RNTRRARGQVPNALGPAGLRAGPFCVQPRTPDSQPNSGASMPEVHLSETDRIDWALKTFKRQMQKSGVLRELRKRRHYVKPSEARAIKSKAAQRGRDRAARKDSSHSR